MLTVLRRVLSHRVSVEELIEYALWCAIPYLLVGVVWTFLHADVVDRLQTQLPAGADVVAFGQTILLWPILALGAQICG
jgi:hypothetical protein